MREHLSPRRLAETVAAGATPAENRHLLQCAQCAAEAANLQVALANFRDGVVAHALTHRSPEFAPAGREIWSGRWLLCAAAALLLATPLYHTVSDRHLAAQAVADAQLIEQVDREIAEAVPSAMQPLEQLVVWNSTSPESSQKGDVR